MINSNNLMNYIRVIKGKRLDNLNLACEMIMFSFGEFELHAQCLTRIIKENDILVTTWDYQNWDEECEKNNDEWYFVNQYKDTIIGGAVIDININCINDVTIILDNGIQIQLFISSGYHHYSEETEQWVFFKHEDDSYPFISVSSKSIDITQEC